MKMSLRRSSAYWVRAGGRHLLYFCLSLGCATGAVAQAGSPEIIRNVNIVTLDERGLLNGYSVEVRDGKITRLMKPAEKTTAGARVIDGQGRFLIPGLIDSHTHFEAEHELTSQLSYGVTTVFSLGNTDLELPGLFKGLDDQKHRRFVGAHLYATGPIIPVHRELHSVAEVKPFFDFLQQHGLRYAKVYNEISQPLFDAIVSEAHKRNMGVFGHLPVRFPVEYALSHGLDVVAHMEEFFFGLFNDDVTDSALPTLSPDWAPDLQVGARALDVAAANHVAIIPNLVASYNFRALWADEDKEFSVPDAKTMDADVIAAWRTENYTHRNLPAKRQLREELKYPFLRWMTYQAQQKGIELLAGTDSPIPTVYPGRSLQQELRLLAAAGLTNEQVLRAATINAGDVVHRLIDHNVCIGQIKEGCEADLVLLDGNPLNDIRNAGHIVGVMSDGSYYTRASLDRLVRLKGRLPRAARSR